MAIYKNLRGSTAVTTELVAPGASFSPLKIQVTNVHSSATATFSLFLQNAPISSAASTFVCVNKKVIANADYLTLTDELPGINAGFGLYATIGSSDEVDIFLT